MGCDFWWSSQKIAVCVITPDSNNCWCWYESLGVHIRVYSVYILWMCIFLAPTYACTKWITEYTRCTLDHFGWGPFLEQQQSGIGYGAMTRTCWKKLLSKARSDFPRLSQIIPKLSQICVPNLLSSSENSCHCAGGHLTRAALQALPGAAHGLVRKYVDKRGKRRHVGVPDRLRSSQCLDSNSALQLKLCCVFSGVYTPQIYVHVCVFVS